MSNKIYVDGIDIRKAIQEAYRLSSPMGLGQFHFRPGMLTDTEIDEIIKDGESSSKFMSAHDIVYMDYVNGRCCKFHLEKETAGGRLFVWDKWQDHTREQLDELIANSMPVK